MDNEIGQNLLGNCVTEIRKCTKTNYTYTRFTV